MNQFQLRMSTFKDVEIKTDVLYRYSNREDEDKKLNNYHNIDGPDLISILLISLIGIPIALVLIILFILESRDDK